MLWRPDSLDVGGYGPRLDLSRCKQGRERGYPVAFRALKLAIGLGFRELRTPVRRLLIGMEQK